MGGLSHNVASVIESKYLSTEPLQSPEVESHKHGEGEEIVKKDAVISLILMMKSINFLGEGGRVEGFVGGEIAVSLSLFDLHSPLCSI